MTKRKLWDSGNVVQIPLFENYHAYGVIIRWPLMGFTGAYNKEFDDVSFILGAIKFKVWVMKYAIGKKGWPVIGQVDLSEIAIEPTRFYKFDVISKKFTIYEESGKESPATREMCLNLECAAVWDPSHIIERIIDEFNGIENMWTKSLNAKNRA